VNRRPRRSRTPNPEPLPTFLHVRRRIGILDVSALNTERVKKKIKAVR